MGRLKLADIDESYIKNFLKYNDKILHIDKKAIFYSAIVNMGLFLTSILFYENIMIAGCIAVVIDICIFISLTKFMKKEKIDHKDLNLFFGCYQFLLSISLCNLGCALLKIEIRRYGYVVLLVSIITLLLVTLITFYSYKRKIACDYFKKNTQAGRNGSNMLTIGIALAGVGISKILDSYNVSFFLQLGAMLIIVGLIFTQSIYILMKYYCYCLLENGKERKTDF